MKTPCEQCPFLKKNAGMIYPERLGSIANDLLHDRDFPCHKTIDYSSENPARTPQTQGCFGATLWMEAYVDGGCRSNLMQRMGMRARHFTIDDLRSDDSIIDVFGQIEND